MVTIKVGVLRGGPSGEHEISLRTGENVLSNLPGGYKGHDIFISKNGEWNLDGRPALPENIFHNIDVAFNAMHGEFGEDGKVQQILEAFKVPYTGSGVMASAVGMNKIFSRESFEREGLRVPRAFVVEITEDAQSAAERIFRKMGPSWVIKPVSGGSSLGMKIAHKFHDLVKGIRHSFGFDRKVLVEEYIKGREATCGVIEGFRNQKLYALPAIEIITPENAEFFDYESKYGGASREVCPGNFSVPEKRKIEEMARRAHSSIGARHYSRSDFIITPSGKIYTLEINTLPGLTAESLLPKAFGSVGSSYGDFLDHVITLALNK